MSDVPRLRMRGIDKSFGGVAVLSDVDFVLEPGEVVALLGANGAGKSTLMKILTGVYRRDAGEVLVDGVAVAFDTPAEAVAAGVRLLPQEISVLPDMTVAENVCMGDLPMRRRIGLGVVDDGEMRRRSRDLLDRLGFGAIDTGTPVRRLPVAEQRIVEVARALAGQARILVMDEPTASLTEQEAKIIFGIIRALKQQSVSVVYISHYLNEVFEISDRIAVLRDGRTAGVFPTATTSRATVLAAMLGATLGDLYAAGEPAIPGADALRVEKLTLPGRLRDVSLSIREGEIFGVFGLVGSGVEVLGRAIYGALGPLPAGRVALAGNPYRPRTPRAGKAAGIGFVAAERKKEGIIADLTVRENIALPFVERYERGPFVDRARETAVATRWIDILHIRTQGAEQEIRTLSGGNQQKVCIARWLVDGVKLLILEEPTRGVDVGARREIYAQLRVLAARGYAVLILSSDVEEVAGISDRSIVLDRGRVVGAFGRDASPAALMAATSPDPSFSAAEAADAERADH